MRSLIEQGREFIRERRIPEIKVYRFGEESRGVITKPTLGGLCLPLYIRDDTILDTSELLEQSGQNIVQVNKHGVKMYQETTEYEAEEFVETTKYNYRIGSVTTTRIPVRTVRVKAI